MACQVVLLGFGEFALAVVNGAQVDQRAGGSGIQFQHLLVRLDGLLHGRAGLFQFQPLLKPGLGFARAVGRAACAPGKLLMPPSSAASKSNRIWPLMASIFCPATCTAMLPAVGDDAQFAERLLHPAQLFAQRFQGAADLPAPGCWFSRSLMRVWMAIRSEKE